MPDSNGNQTPEELIQQAQQLAQRQQLEHAREVQELIELGRETRGNAPFDEKSQVFSDKIGPQRLQETMALLRQFDKPIEVIEHLAENEGRLDQFAKLSPARQAVEIARIEAQLSSHGHVNTGADRAWKQPSARGRVNDQDWRRTYGANLTDDQWNAEFDRRQAEKAKRR